MGQITIPMPEHIMTMSELKEFHKLRDELFGDNRFVVLDMTDPKNQRFDMLSGKFLKFRNYIKRQQELN